MNQSRASPERLANWESSVGCTRPAPYIWYSFMKSTTEYSGMPTRSSCQEEFRWPMSLPSALKVSSGCISTTMTFAPSSAARRAVAVPAWPAPHTIMSASWTEAISSSAISGSSPSQPAPGTSPIVLPSLPVAAAVLPVVAMASPPRGSEAFEEHSVCGLHPAIMPAAAAPAAITPAPCRKPRRLSAMRPRLSARASRSSSML